MLITIVVYLKSNEQIYTLSNFKLISLKKTGLNSVYFTTLDFKTPKT